MIQEIRYCLIMFWWMVIGHSNYATAVSYMRENHYRRQYAVKITKHHEDWTETYIRQGAKPYKHFHDYLEKDCNWELNKKMFNIKP